MRLLFTIYVAIAACRVGAGSHAAPSRSVPKSPRSLLGVSTKKHVRSDELALDDEERVQPFDLNEIPSGFEEKIEEVVGKTVESSAMETEARDKIRSEVRKYNEEIRVKTLESSTMETVNSEQMAKVTASEETKKKQLEYDRKQESLLNYLYSEVSAKEVFDVLLDGRQVEPSQLEKAEESNLAELLDDWHPTVEPIESESKSSTKRLQYWLTTEESSDKLFKVLGIHKAVDKNANSLLISLNLERWNHLLKSRKLDGNNFKENLHETLRAYCRDETRAELFMTRLSILRQKADSAGLTWLREGKEPNEVLKLMGLSDKETVKKVILRKWEKSLNWIVYVDAFNDLYPSRQTTLLAATSYSERQVIKMALRKTVTPKQNVIMARFLTDIFKSWANLMPPFPPKDAYFRLGLKRVNRIALRSRGMIAWIEYVDLFNAGKSKKDQVSYISVLRELFPLEEILFHGPTTKNQKLAEDFTLHFNTKTQDVSVSKRIESSPKHSQSETKNPLKRVMESPPEDTRDRRRPRGE